MKIRLFIFLLCIPFFSFADRFNTDSLKTELAKTSVDTAKVRLYIYLWESTAYSNPDEAQTYAIEALSISRKINYKKGLADAYQRIASGFTTKSVTDSASYYYNKALSIYTELNDIKMESVILSNIAILYYEQGDYLKAMFKTEESLRKSSEIADMHGIAVSLQLLGNIHYYMGNFDEAQKYHLQSVQKLEELGDEIRYADGLVYLASNYHALKKYRKALKNLEDAIEIYRQKNDRFFQCQALNNTGYIYMEIGKNDSAKIYLNQGIELATEIGNNNAVLLGNNSLGIIAKNEGNFELAESNFQLAFKLAVKHNDQLRLSLIYRNLGDIYTLQNQFNKAIPSYDSAIAIAERIGAKSSLKNAYKSISDNWAKQGNYKQSLEYYKLFTAMKDSILDKDKTTKIEELEARYRKAEDEKEIAIQKSQISILSKDLELQRIRQIVIFSGLILFIIGAILFILHLRNRMKKNRLFREQERLIEQEKLKIAQLERDNYEKELTFKNNELTSHALQIAQKNELLDKLRHTIREIELKSATDQKQFRDLRFMINGNAQTDKDWENFNKHFEQVHQNFYSKLKSHQQELTGNDLRLSAMLRMNLSTKEVAAILSISPESVKKARYRLKKKLQLEEEKDLHSFMMEV